MTEQPYPQAGAEARTEQIFRDFLFERHGLIDVQEIGRGGMGRVYRAHEQSLGRNVAVKRLREGVTPTDEDYRRFHTEMRILASISHPAVVGIHYAGVTPAGEAYFVMEYIEGRNLSETINARKDWSRGFTVEETVRLLRPVAGALDHIHTRCDPPIVHRDVKPANILVPSGRGRGVASMLTDFGISLTPEATRVTELSKLVGTENYLAPELYPGGEAAAAGNIHPRPSAQTDNYALALVAFEMLTQLQLRDTMTPWQWMHDRPFPDVEILSPGADDLGVSERVAAVLRRALSLIPAQRYRSATEFVDALARTAPGSGGEEPGHLRLSPAPAYPQHNDAPTRTGPVIHPGAPPPPPAVAVGAAGRPKKRRTGAIVGGAAAATVIVAGLAGLGWYGTHPAWAGKDRAVAQAFDSIIGDREGPGRWSGMTCRSDVPAGGQDAKIKCTGRGLGMSFIDFGSRQARDGYAEDSHAGDGETFSRGQCTVDVAPLPTADGAESAYLMLPQEDRSRFGVMVWGEKSQDSKTRIPIC